MSDNSEIIRSFLVSVGVQVDENGMQRFGRAVEGVTKTVVALGTAVAAMATATAAAVIKVSDQFDDLYYASQRLKSSVTNIKAFDYGVSQMGGTAQGARQSLEGLASFMRSNPGGEGFLASLGISTRDAGGNLRDTTNVMRDLFAQFQKMPYPLAKIRAEMLGIDEITLQAGLRGTDLWSEQFATMAGDLDQAAEASARFMQMIRRLRAQLEIGLYKTLLRIQQAIGPGLERAGKIGLAIFEAFARLAEQLVDWLGKLDRETGGWSTTIGAVAAAFGVLAVTVGPVVGLVLALVGAVALLIDDFNTWKAGGESLVDWDKWAPGIEAAINAVGNLASGIWDLVSAFGPVIEGIGKFLGVLFPFGDQLKSFGEKFVDSLITKIWRLGESFKALAALMRGDLKASGIHSYNAQFGSAPSGASAQARAAAMASNDNGGGASSGVAVGASGGSADAMNYFMRMGWSREQAAGIVANLNAESNLNSGAVGDGGRAYGVAQWHPDRQAAFKRWLGKDIRNSTLQEQLAFVHYEMTRGNEQAAGRNLKGAKSAREAGAIVSSQYERPADRLGEMAKRGANAEALLKGSRLGQDRGATTVNVNSKTEIKVSGGGDAKETAKHVETAADRAYTKMVRNTKGAVR